MNPRLTTNRRVGTTNDPVAQRSPTGFDATPIDISGQGRRHGLRQASVGTLPPLPLRANLGLRRAPGGLLRPEILGGLA